MKRPLLLSYVLLLSSPGGSFLHAAEPAVSIQALPAIEEVSFPDGYAVYASPDLSKPATKRVPGPTTARIAAYADVPAGRLYLSDWSYERKQKGQSHFWMFIPRPDAPEPAAAPGGVTRESVVTCGVQEVAMAKGYTVVDAPHVKAKLLKTVKQGEKMKLAGYLETKDGLYFITDWSWDRWEKEAKAPNWIRLPDPESAQSLKGILDARLAEVDVESFATDEMSGVKSTVYDRRQLLKMRDARLPAGHPDRLAAIFLLYESEKAWGNTTRARELARRYLDEGKGSDSRERLSEIGLMHFHLGNFREADQHWARHYHELPPSHWDEPSAGDLVDAKLRGGGSPEDPLVLAYERQILSESPGDYFRLEKIYRETGRPEKAARLAKDAQAALNRLKGSMALAARQGKASPSDLWELAQAYHAAGDAAACKEVLGLAGSRKWDPRGDDVGNDRFGQVSPLFCLALMAEKQGLKTEQASLTTAGMDYAFWREDNLEHAGNVDDVLPFLNYAAALGESATKRVVLDQVVEVLRPTRFQVWPYYNEGESLKCDLPAFGKDGPSLAALAIANKNYQSECRAIEMRLTRLATEMPATEKLTTRLKGMKQRWEGTYGSPEWDRLQAEVDQIFTELRAIAGANSRWLRNDVPTLADVQKELSPKTALVEIVRAPMSRYSAAVVTHSGAPVFLDLGEADVINELIRRYREIIIREPRQAEDAKPFEEICRELYRMLAAPVEKAIAADVTDLVICPDDQLHFLSFATLLNERGAMWIENRRICYVANGRDLARTPAKDVAIRSALLIGNPDYKATGPELALGRASGGGSAGEQLLARNERSASRADLNGVYLSPLPGTAAEVEQLVKLFAEKQIPAETWLEAAASETRLSRIKGPTILHLATHGFYFDELTRGRAGTLEKESVISPSERAGVAISGAQTTIRLWQQGRIPPRAEDGLLMADEAAMLNLDGTYLVTLSACETGLGESLSGGGIAGLKSSLALAGAENTLLTLWPINDDATVGLMLDFYRRLMAGESPARALAELQRLRLPELRRSKGLLEAVNQAGAFTLSTRAGLR